MWFSDYELQARTTASYKDADYLPLGLAEECGELVHEFARCKRKGVPMDIDNLMSEVGDVLWMLAMISHEHGFNLEDAAQNNMDKLSGRNEAGTIHDKTGRSADMSDEERNEFLRYFKYV